MNSILSSRKILVACIALIVSVSLSSCKITRVIEQVPVEVHDTAYLSKVEYDSIYIDHFREVTKMMNDTVYIHDSTLVYRYRVKTDTAYKYIEKPVEIIKEQIKEVEKSLSWLQKTLIGIGIASLIVLLIKLALHFFKR